MKKAHGKGLGISINEPNKCTSTVNAFKMELAKVAPPAVHTFRPLTSWPAKPHPQQDRLDADKAILSRFA